MDFNIFSVLLLCFVRFGASEKLQIQNNVMTNQEKELEVFSFASYYGNNMVLQRAPKRAGLWGVASLSDVGQSVDVTITGAQGKKSYKAKVEMGPYTDRSVWRVTLDPLTDAGPYTITAMLGDHTPIKLDNVLAGDVWMCGGQSNMQFSVAQMFDYREEKEEANNLPNIRIFMASLKESTTPQYDLLGVNIPWSVASSESLGSQAWNGFSAVCWRFGRNLYKALGIPIGLIESDWGGTPVEAWSSPDALKVCGITEKYKPDPLFYQYGFTDVGGPGDHSVLWNAMIHPLLNLTVTGAIWYQGEANAHNPDTYNCTFPAMINDWRAKFYEGNGGKTDPKFPFGFVQIGPNTVNATHVPRGYASVRWHQTADYGYTPNPKMDNVFMATAVDLTDNTSPYGPVHIRDKKSVGDRLSWSGLTLVYGQSHKHWGPMVSEYTQTGTGLHLVFDQGKTPIVVKTKTAFGFQLCCKSSKSVTCQIDSTIEWTDTVIMTSDSTSVTIGTCTSGYLTGVRYIWGETPCQYRNCPVYSVENDLPAPPFVMNISP